MPDINAGVQALASSALQILIVAVVAYIVLRLSRRYVSGIMVRALQRREADPEIRELTRPENEQRVATLNALVGWVLRLIIIVAAGSALLVAFGLTPVIGLIGLLLAAAAFVAQDVIRDYVGGAIIVLENQFGIGDVVRVAGVTGTVEALSLRRTTIRNDDGDQVTVPNGEIRVAANLTRIWSALNVEIAIVDPNAVDAARAVIDATGVDLAADPVLGPAVLQVPAFVRVVGFDNGVRLLIRGRVRAADRLVVTGEYRRRLLVALEAAGVVLVTGQRLNLFDPGPAA